MNVLHGLRDNPCDVPFALAYSVVDEAEVWSATEPLKDYGLVLEGTLGLTPDNAGVPYAHHLFMDCAPFLAAVDKIRKSPEVVLFPVNDEKLSTALVPYGDLRGYGDRIRRFALCPIGPTTSVKGVLILGLNTRTPYNIDYQRFVDVLCRELSLSLASKMLLNEYARAERAAAASEARFKRMVETSPIGAFMMRHNGQMMYVNDNWMQITGYVHLHARYSPTESILVSGHQTTSRIRTGLLSLI